MPSECEREGNDSLRVKQPEKLFYSHQLTRETTFLGMDTDEFNDI